MQIIKANRAHNGGYLTQGPTLVLIVVVLECNPTRPPGRPTGFISLTAPVAYQVILEPGIGQLREFEPPRVRTRMNFRGNFSCALRV